MGGTARESIGPLGYAAAWREVSDPARLPKQPLVSVKMLTYNHEPYIAKAIEGVLMQKTDFPIELVVGEDRSTDRTREIVIWYQRNHPNLIRVVLWDRNVGARRNSVAVDEVLRGKYVAFNEGDDHWTHPKKLQMQVDVMEASPEVGMVHGGAHIFNAESRRTAPWVPRRADYDSGDVFLKLLTRRYRVFTVTACVRRDLMLRVMRENPDSFDLRFPMTDLSLWLELSRVAKVRLLNEPLATYCALPESASRSRDVDKLVHFAKSGAALRMHFARKYGCPKDVEDTILTGRDSAILRYAFVFSNRDLAVEARNGLVRISNRLTFEQSIWHLGAANRLGRLVVRNVARPLAELRNRVLRWWAEDARRPRPFRRDAASPHGDVPVSALEEPVRDAGERPGAAVGVAVSAGEGRARLPGPPAPSLATISVVIPLYNKVRHVQRALDSVLAQTFPSLEVIVVNDGSTDGSERVVERYTDPRIRLVRREHVNSWGGHAARNRGIAEARADLIAFLDADDEWLPGHLAAIHRLATRHPQCGAFCTNHRTVETNGRLRPSSFTFRSDSSPDGVLSDYFRQALTAFPVNSTKVAIPRRVFEECGLFPENAHEGGDLDMWCRIALKYPIAYSTEVGAIYHKDSDNRLGQRAHASLRWNLVKTLEHALATGGYLESIDRADLAEYLNQSLIIGAIRSVQQGDRRHARDLLARASDTRVFRALLLRWKFLSGLPSPLLGLALRVRTGQGPNGRVGRG